jgi:cytochrome c
MNTMTVTKVVAAFCGALLVFLLGNWAAGSLYTMDGIEEGKAVYAIETAESEVTAEVALISFDEMMAAADVAKGAKLFKKCAACHKLEDGANATGPFLYAVVGRAIGSVAGFGYSSALTDIGGDWTLEELDAFLTKPSAYAPGTKMSFSGLKKPEDRVDLIAFLDSLDN